MRSFRMTWKNGAFLLIGALAFVGTLALFLVPMKIPYSIEVPGRMMPIREWILTTGENGQLRATLYDHIPGTMRTYSVTQFERGDVMRFTLHPAIRPGASVATGDTVGVIYSNKTEHQLAQLTGALSTAMASLNLYRSGEKESVIREAQQRLAHAREQAEEQRKILERLRMLYERDFISEQEIEIAESTLGLYDIHVTIAEAQLQTVQTGSKEEQIDLVCSRIRALKEEMNTVRKRLEHLTLISPLSGVVFRFFSGDTLVAMGDTAAYVVVMPVKWKDRRYLTSKQEVTLNVDGLHSSLHGTLLQLGRVVQVLNGQQVLWATAIVKPNAEGLAPGLIVRCSISCEPVRPIQYLGRVIRAALIP